MDFRNYGNRKNSKFSLLMSFSMQLQSNNFFKKKNLWFERFVGINDHKKLFF